MLKKLLSESISDRLVTLTISNPRKKQEPFSKYKIRPIYLNENLVFQIESFKNNQAFHENLSTKECQLFILDLVENNIYKQMDISTTSKDIHILFNKKGNAHIKEKNNPKEHTILTHNRQKEYLLDPNTPIPFLIELGVMTKEGKIVDKKYNKFKQINRYLEMVNDVLPKLDDLDTINIIDFGCGKSYLTFALYYFLVEIKKRKVNIVGLDLKEDVINHCNQLANTFKYDDLVFKMGNINDYNDATSVDMVVTLHACDTATDMALQKAVGWNAKVIMSVPCCQHELNSQIQCDPLNSILKYGIIKERMSALITDAMRGNWLEIQGYEVQILEFIDVAHTPKNLLIRATKKENAGNTEGLQSEFDQLEELLNGDLSINNRIV